jgi:hypothetical protein
MGVARAGINLPARRIVQGFVSNEQRSACD